MFHKVQIAKVVDRKVTESQFETVSTATLHWTVQFFREAPLPLEDSFTPENGLCFRSSSLDLVPCPYAGIQIKKLVSHFQRFLLG